MKKLLIAYFLLGFLCAEGVSQVRKDADGLYYGSDGKPFTGHFEEYDENNKILIKRVSMLTGRLHGEARLYNPDGTLAEIQMYVRGLMDGRWITYNRDGIATAEASYQEGLKNGPWIIRDDSGNLLFEMFYAKGNRTGTWVKYDAGGNILNSIEY